MMFYRLEAITKESQDRNEEVKFGQKRNYFQLKKKDRKEEALGKN